MTNVLVVALGTLGNLDGDVGGDGSLGRRGRANSLDGNLPHIWRGMAGEMKMNAVVTGH